MMLSVSNIRDMLADEQEELVKAYIGMFSCAVEQEDGSMKELNPDIERFLNSNAGATSASAIFHFGPFWPRCCAVIRHVEKKKSRRSKVRSFVTLTSAGKEEKRSVFDFIYAENCGKLAQARRRYRCWKCMDFPEGMFVRYMARSL